MPKHFLQTRGATLFATFSEYIEYVLQLYARTRTVATFFWLFYCMEANHPDLLTVSITTFYRYAEDFLRLAAHEGVLGRLHHSELPLSFGSLLGAVSHTLFAQRGSVLCLYNKHNIVSCKVNIATLPRQGFSKVAFLPAHPPF